MLGIKLCVGKIYKIQQVEYIWGCVQTCPNPLDGLIGLASSHLIPTHMPWSKTLTNLIPAANALVAPHVLPEDKSATAGATVG